MDYYFDDASDWSCDEKFYIFGPGPSVSAVYGLPSVYGLRSTVYGLRSTVHGLRSTVHGPRFTVYGLRSTVYGLRSTVYSGLRSTAVYD
ncbi:hypothetical protein BC938DRAFT_481757 [Jimgerdemannia flammicorona]|uniref:Uncharacterized protein n=1 Tax=Jimgerdemannia flammicorona TaxID=994334 RepID=A0A433QFE8_9FUNG|nr:hypothetical protein BC938DRAFT_481757 [Jimgerdemannia flammicorona]